MSDEILEELKARMLPYNVVVTEFAIVNFSFSQQFTQAIEDKQTAEQKALKAEQDLKRVEIEAQQKVALARAEGRSAPTAARRDFAAGDSAARHRSEDQRHRKMERSASTG